VRVQLCFGLAGTGCTAASVTAVDVRGPQRDQVDRANATQIVLALEALGGVTEGTRVTFAPALATTVCTPPFHMLVPLETKAARPRRGMRRFAVTAHAGRTDRDALRLMCVP
jgi:hypothetical protein